MTTYTNIQANTQASEPLTTTVVTALDRNLYALFEGDSTATPFAQLQEPAIQTAAINPVKFAPVTAPTSTSTGVFTNAAFHDALGLQSDRTSSSTSTFVTVSKSIKRAGDYTFYCSSFFRQFGTSNNYIVKTEFIVDGVIRFTHNFIQAAIQKDQVTLSLTGGEEYFIKNYYVSGSTGASARTEVFNQCLVMINQNSSMNDVELDRGLNNYFESNGTRDLRLSYTNQDANNLTTGGFFGAPSYWIFYLTPNVNESTTNSVFES